MRQWKATSTSIPLTSKPSKGKDRPSDLFFGSGRPEVEPHAEIRVMAQVAMQVYKAFKDEGFSGEDALELTKTMMVNGQKE